MPMVSIYSASDLIKSSGFLKKAGGEGRSLMGDLNSLLYKASFLDSPFINAAVIF